MKNTYKLIWSNEAVAGLKEIIAYIEQYFSEKEVRKFIKKFDGVLDIMKSDPETFSHTPKSKKLRRAIVAKLT